LTGTGVNYNVIFITRNAVTSSDGWPSCHVTSTRNSWRRGASEWSPRRYNLRPSSTTPRTTISNTYTRTLAATAALAALALRVHVASWITLERIPKNC